jgi:hypothetical protein
MAARGTIGRVEDGQDTGGRLRCRVECLPLTAMPLFWKPYKSEVTQFIEELKAKKPSLEDEQRAGRALLWDKAIDREAEAAWRQSRVPQKPYVYQTDV